MCIRDRMRGGRAQCLNHFFRASPRTQYPITVYTFNVQGVLAVWDIKDALWLWFNRLQCWAPSVILYLNGTQSVPLLVLADPYCVNTFRGELRVQPPSPKCWKTIFFRTVKNYAMQHVIINARMSHCVILCIITSATLLTHFSHCYSWSCNCWCTFCGACIGVNPVGDTGDTSPAKIGLRGTVLHYVPRKFSCVKGVFGVNATLNTCHWKWFKHWNVQSDSF